MQLEEYFDFLAQDDIRLKGTRVGIVTILYDYIHRLRSPEEIAATYPLLTLEQVYATILYYLHNQVVMSQAREIISGRSLSLGSSNGLDYQGHAKWYFNIVHAYAHTLEQMFDYHTTANGLISTFEKLASGTITPVKVLVQYNIAVGRE